MIYATFLSNLALIISGSNVGIALGVAFFFVFAVAALIAYKLLRRTVKMAIRMTIVAVILLVAIVGGVALFMFGASNRLVRQTSAPSPRSGNSVR